MTIDDFTVLWNRMCKEEEKILITKGVEYSGKEDRLANFKRLAMDLGMDPKQILWVYLVKHLDSIRSYIRMGKSYSTETIESRIHDARNYLALLNGLIQDDKVTATNYMHIDVPITITKVQEKT